MKDVNTKKRLSFSSFELRYGLKNSSPEKNRGKAVRFAATLILRDVFVALAVVFAFWLAPEPENLET